MTTEQTAVAPENTAAPESTADDLLMSARMLGLETPKKAEPEPTPPPATTETPPAAQAETPPAEPPKVEAPPETKKGAKAKAKAKAEPGLTAEQVADIAAKTAAATTVATAKAAADAAPKPPEPEPDSPELVRYKKLEELLPAKYPPGFAARQAEFEKKAALYEKTWRKKHPGEAFDPENTEHDEFYATQPELDEDDLKKADRALLLDEAVTVASKKQQAELERIQRELTRIKAEPEASKAADLVVSAVIKTLAPDLTDLSHASLTEWAGKNPIVAKQLFAHQQGAHELARTASLLWDNVQAFDENNPAHVAARSAAIKFERDLASADPEALTDEQGRQWVPLAEYSKMNPAQRARHRTTEKQHVLAYISAVTADTVKREAESLRAQAEEIAKSLGYVKPGASQTTPPAPPPVVDPALSQPPSATRSTVSPSIGGGTPTAPQKGTVKVEGENTEALFDRLWS